MGEKRATLKDVAERSGYALRTVKNVVAGKSSVGEPVREAVLKAMQELDYKPNFLASTLAKNRTFLIAAVILEGENEHQQGILKGIRAAARQYEDYGLAIEFHLTQRQEHEQEVILEEFYERSELDGVILQPCAPGCLSRQVNLLMYSGKPVVLIDQQTAGADPVCYVGQDHFQVGRVSAQLLGRYLRGKGTIIALYDDLYGARLEAFRKYMLEHFPGIILNSLDTLDPGAMPLEKAMANVHPDGIYDCSGSDRYLPLLEKTWKKGDTIVLSNNISFENRAYLKNEMADVLVGEETEETGMRSVSVLFRYLNASALPPKKVFTRITILTSECLGNNQEGI